jgi:hypothetical protein
MLRHDEAKRILISRTSLVNTTDVIAAVTTLEGQQIQ